MELARWDLFYEEVKFKKHFAPLRSSWTPYDYLEEWAGYCLNYAKDFKKNQQHHN